MVKSIFASFEYLESFRERVSNLNNFANDLSGHMLLLEDINCQGFKIKCEIVIDSCLTYFKDLLDYIENFDTPLQEKIRTVYNEHKHLDGYDTALRAIELAINQRVISPNYEENAFPEYLFGCYHPKVARAIDNLVSHLTTLFFGKAREKSSGPEGVSTQIVPLTIFGSSPRHQISTIRLFGHKNKTVLLFLVNIPKTDAYRYRFLTSLCHEISHVKLRLTWQSSLLKEADLYLEYPEEGQKLYDEIIDELQTGIIKAYVSSEIYENDFTERMRAYVGSITEQVEEILADFASLTIFGLADLSTLICWSGDPAQELEEKKLRPIDHPPLPIRANYMINYLKSLNCEEPEYKKALFEIENNWKEIEETNQELVPFKKFLDSYKEVVNGSADKIVDFVKNYLMPNSIPFSSVHWERCVSTFKRKKDIEKNKGIDCPVTFIIRAWAKRWFIHQKLSKSGKGDLKRFLEWHKTETKLLGQIINELNQG